MSLADFDERDLDRLADYTAGVLGGDQADQVAHLIATDPRWQAGHASLRRASTAVRADLQAAARHQLEPMPADVVARIDHALVNAGAAAPTRLAAATPARLAAVADLDAARPGRRRRLTRLSAAAAVLVALVGAGAVLRSVVGATPVTNGAAAQARDNAAAAPGAASALGQPTIRASGRDYRADTLASVLQPPPLAAPTMLVSPAAPPATPNRTPALGGSAEKGALDIEPALARLADPTNLRGCTDQLLAAHPGEVVAVDYARFDGAPAVVVAIRHSSTTTIVAVGAACGVAGADELATVEAP